MKLNWISVFFQVAALIACKIYSFELYDILLSDDLWLDLVTSPKTAATPADHFVLTASKQTESSGVTNTGISLTISPNPFKQYDYQAYSQWSKLNALEKLEYLLDIRDLRLLFAEYQRFAPTSTDRGTLYIDQQALYLMLSDFQTRDNIERFFVGCDANRDSLVSFIEYVVCRGDFDKNGNIVNNNEWDMRGAAFANDFEKLVATSPQSLGIYKYDENGIIID